MATACFGCIRSQQDLKDLARSAQQEISRLTDLLAVEQRRANDAEAKLRAFEVAQLGQLIGISNQGAPSFLASNAAATSQQPSKYNNPGFVSSVAQSSTLSGKSRWDLCKPSFSELSTLDSSASAYAVTGDTSDVDQQNIEKRVLKYFTEEIFADKYPFLPPDWEEYWHDSGVPIYKHLPTSVYTLSRPFCSATFPRAASNCVPLASVPCFYWRILQNWAQANPDAAVNAVQRPDGDRIEILPPPQKPGYRLTDFLSSEELKLYAEGAYHFTSKQTTLASNVREPVQKQVYPYAKFLKLRAEEKRKQQITHEKCRKAETEGKWNAEVPNSRSIIQLDPYVCSDPEKLIQEFSSKMKQPVVFVPSVTGTEFLPIKITVKFGDASYGSAMGISEDQAMYEACVAAAEKLCCQYKASRKRFGLLALPTLPEDLTLFKIFDTMLASNPQISNLTEKSAHPRVKKLSPLTLFSEFLRRNVDKFGEIPVLHQFRSVLSSSVAMMSRADYWMRVGDLEVAVPCSSADEGKARAAQTILAKFHSKLKFWGEIARVYLDDLPPLGGISTTSGSTFGGTAIATSYSGSGGAAITGATCTSSSTAAAPSTSTTETVGLKSLAGVARPIGGLPSSSSKSVANDIPSRHLLLPSLPTAEVMQIVPTFEELQLADHMSHTKGLLIVSRGKHQKMDAKFWTSLRKIKELDPTSGAFDVVIKKVVAADPALGTVPLEQIVEKYRRFLPDSLGKVGACFAYEFNPEFLAPRKHQPRYMVRWLRGSDTAPVSCLLEGRARWSELALNLVSFGVKLESFAKKQQKSGGSGNISQLDGSRRTVKEALEEVRRELPYYVALVELFTRKLGPEYAAFVTAVANRAQELDLSGGTPQDVGDVSEIQRKGKGGTAKGSGSSKKDQGPDLEGCDWIVPLPQVPPSAPRFDIRPAQDQIEFVRNLHKAASVLRDRLEDPESLYKKLKRAEATIKKEGAEFRDRTYETVIRDVAVKDAEFSRMPLAKTLEKYQQYTYGFHQRREAAQLGFFEFELNPTAVTPRDSQPKFLVQWICGVDTTPQLLCVENARRWLEEAQQLTEFGLKIERDIGDRGQSVTMKGYDGSQRPAVAALEEIRYEVSQYLALSSLFERQIQPATAAFVDDLYRMAWRLGLEPDSESRNRDSKYRSSSKSYRSRRSPSPFYDRSSSAMRRKYHERDHRDRGNPADPRGNSTSRRSRSRSRDERHRPVKRPRTLPPPKQSVQTEEASSDEDSVICLSPSPSPQMAPPGDECQVIGGIQAPASSGSDPSSSGGAINPRPIQQQLEVIEVVPSTEDKKLLKHFPVAAAEILSRLDQAKAMDNRHTRAFQRLAEFDEELAQRMGESLIQKYVKKPGVQRALAGGDFEVIPPVDKPRPHQPLYSIKAVRGLDSTAPENIRSARIFWLQQALRLAEFSAEVYEFSARFGAEFSMDLLDGSTRSSEQALEDTRRSLAEYLALVSLLDARVAYELTDVTEIEDLVSELELRTGAVSG